MNVLNVIKKLVPLVTNDARNLLTYMFYKAQVSFFTDTNMSICLRPSPSISSPLFLSQTSNFSAFIITGIP
jgi:hypothetical protein